MTKLASLSRVESDGENL